jgi:hypothetical protein
LACVIFGDSSSPPDFGTAAFDQTVKCDPQNLWDGPCECTSSPKTSRSSKSKSHKAKEPKTKKRRAVSAMASATPPALKSSTVTTTVVALVAATCVVLVAAAVVVVVAIKKGQVAMARSRVQPFNAEREATDANAKPSANYATPPTNDGSKGDNR